MTDDPRARRLAEQLRANLKRRKAQARAAASIPMGAPVPPSGGELDRDPGGSGT